MSADGNGRHRQDLGDNGSAPVQIHAERLIQPQNTLGWTTGREGIGIRIRGRIQSVSVSPFLNQNLDRLEGHRKFIVRKGRLPHNKRSLPFATPRTWPTPQDPQGSQTVPENFKTNILHSPLSTTPPTTPENVNHA